MSIDYIIIIFIMILLLVGLSLLFMFITLFKIHDRVNHLEEKVKSLIEGLS